MTQAQSALAKLQAKVEAYDAGQRQQTYVKTHQDMILPDPLKLTMRNRMSLLEGHVAEIMQSLEKRRALEARQARLISKMHASVRVVEEMMDTGIRGRCVDAEEALSALCSER